MKRLGGRADRTFRNRFPNLYYYLVQRPKISFQFKKERALLNGVRLSKSEHTSILFFTTQKCASRYVSEVIRALCTSAGMVAADYDAYVAMVRLPKQKNPFSHHGTISSAFQRKGYYYGPIGTYRDIPDLGVYKTFLQLRDPRDVLTSLYFSTVYSHALISPKLIRRRKEAQTMGIDEYVIATAEEYLTIYNGYCDHLLGQKNVLFLKYEEMVTDFDAWLQKLSQHLALSDQEEAIEAIRTDADFSMEQEDPYSQRRQIRPGDHRRKLKPETIKKLNKRFKPVLEKLNYPI